MRGRARSRAARSWGRSRASWAGGYRTPRAGGDRDRARAVAERGVSRREAGQREFRSRIRFGLELERAQGVLRLVALEVGVAERVEHLLVHHHQRIDRAGLELAVLLRDGR